MAREREDGGFRNDRINLEKFINEAGDPEILIGLRSYLDYRRFYEVMCVDNYLNGKKLAVYEGSNLSQAIKNMDEGGLFEFDINIVNLVYLLPKPHFQVMITREDDNIVAYQDNVYNSQDYVKLVTSPIEDGLRPVLIKLNKLGSEVKAEKLRRRAEAEQRAQEQMQDSTETPAKDE